MNSFDYNYMKLGHIIKCHNVFKFENYSYGTMPSGVQPLLMAMPYLLAIAGASVSHGHISSFNDGPVIFFYLMKLMSFEDKKRMKQKKTWMMLISGHFLKQSLSV